MPSMSDVLNPVDVENAIAAVNNRIAKGVRVCSDALAAFLKADHEHDVAYATAYMAHEGPAHERKYAAELATQDERTVRDAAYVAHRYAEAQARALENELRGWQSRGASVRSMYGAAGRGES